MRKPESELKQLLAVMDAKSMYDNLTREQYTGAEKRAALEICVIRDSLRQLNGKVFWFPHERNPVDPLTKLKGNCTALLEMMRSGRFQITDVEQEMKDRKAYREQTGKKNPRPKVATASVNSATGKDGEVKLSQHNRATSGLAYIRAMVSCLTPAQ